MKLTFGNKIKTTLSVFVIGQIYAGDSDKTNDIIGLSKSTTERPVVSDVSKNIGNNAHLESQNVISNISTSKGLSTIMSIFSAKDKTLRGRKRENPKNKKQHGKYSDDNCIVKIKTYVIDAVFEFINKKIMEEYKEERDFVYEFKNISPKNYTNNSSDYLFINKTIREIFSSNVSGKYKIIGEDYNRQLIKRLVNDQKNGVLKYLDKKFIEFVEYFSGVSVNEDFKGLKTINDFKTDKVGDDDDYFKYIKNVAVNFRNKILTIRRRSNINSNNLNNIQGHTRNKKRKLSYNKNSTNLQITQKIKSDGINCLILPTFEKELQGDINRNLYNNNIVENKNEVGIKKVDACVGTERVITSDDEDDDNGITETPNIFKKNIL